MIKKCLRCAMPLILTTLFLFPIMGLAHVPTDVNGKPVISLAPMLARVTPAVVNITVERTNDNGTDNGTSPPTKVIGVGSGVIIDANKGYIINNAHVIDHEKMILVTLKDGRHYSAQLIGKDNGFDMAVLQIHANHLIPITYGDSDQLRVGDFVVAIGSPFNLSQTVTSGVISALNRVEPSNPNDFTSFIQTDAPINPGNSGGALIDMQGHLIGVNTAIVSPTLGNIGIGFAIPSNLVRSAANQLIQYGKIERSALGVYVQNITPDLANAFHLPQSQGAIVTQVISQSPAAQAGIQEKDVIESINGNTIHNSEQVHNLLALSRPGTTMHLTLLRNHQPLSLSAVTAASKTLSASSSTLPFLAGMQLKNFDDLEVDGTILSCLLVVNLDDTSAGAIAGLLPGDVIINANSESNFS